MFIDFVGFSKSTISMNPQDLTEALGFYFEKFDEIIDKRNLERIKTIGDGYMCVGGIPSPNNTHAIDCTLAALDIQKFVQDSAEQIRSQYQVSWTVRIGIHTGSLVAGVIGKKRLAYDIWGETVNLASRMETHSAPGKINISAVTYEKVKNFFICQPRGGIKIKNKEGIEELLMEMYFVDGVKPHVKFG
jgi:adenylate cyclase